MSIMFADGAEVSYGKTMTIMFADGVEMPPQIPVCVCELNDTPCACCLTSL